MKKMTLFKVPFLAATLAMSMQIEAAGVFKVCADPNNPPYSTKDGKGFENRIADLLAKSLDQKVEYTWFPQRLGFIRNTLKAKLPDSEEYKCDVIMGIPTGAEMVASTAPYYRSTYVLILRKGTGLDAIKAPADLDQLPDTVKSKLRFAMYDRQPGTDWILKHGFVNQGIPYQSMTGDVTQNSAQVLAQDFQDQKIDLAIVWGPIAAHVGRQKPANYVLIPMKTEAGIRFDFPMSVGVRIPDKDRKEKLDGLLKQEATAIDAVLREFEIPLVDEQGNLRSSR